MDNIPNELNINGNIYILKDVNNKLSELKILKDKYYKYFSEKEALEAVKNDGNALQYVKDQTPEIALEAVKNDGDALRYVKDI